MNTPKVAAALNTISLAFGELAEALVEDGTAPAPVAPAAIYRAAFMPEPVEEVAAEIFPDEGSLSVCPKHHVAYTDGTYGPYCQQTTDDPAWGKAKGDKVWCRITPKNAAEWLRITAA